MKKTFPCVLLASVLTGTQSQALPLDTSLTMGNYSSAMRKIDPKITDGKIYNGYYKIDGKYKTWKDLIQSMNPRNDKQKIANLSSAIDQVSWAEAAAANATDGSQYRSLKLKAAFSK